MSRSGYIDYDDGDGRLQLWRGAVRSAIRGKRGQAFLREMAAAMDAMPDKALIADELETEGEVCAIGSVGVRRGIDMSGLDPEDSEAIARVFGISEALAKEIVYMNDESFDEYRFVKVVICGPMKRPAEHERWVQVHIENASQKRWQYMRDWITKNLVDTPTAPAQGGGK